MESGVDNIEQRTSSKLSFHILVLMVSMGSMYEWPCGDCWRQSAGKRYVTIDSKGVKRY